MIYYFHQYSAPLVLPDGTAYVARVYGRQQPRGLWEAWFVFFPLSGDEPLATDRETTQSKRADIAYWATGISPTYLEGALARALERRPPVQVARRAAAAEHEATSRRAEEDVYRTAAADALARARLAGAERVGAARALAARRSPPAG
jgi:hypothetical protein